MKILFCSLLFVFVATMANSRAESLDLMDWPWRGNVQKSTEEVKEGDFSLRWDAGKGANSNFYSEALDPDWTKFSGLRFWIYSAVATGTRAAISVYPLDVEAGNHYIYEIPVDWEGWKEFEVPLTDFQKNRNPGGWHNIGKVEFLSHFFGEPVPGTLLFISDLKLVD